MLRFSQSKILKIAGFASAVLLSISVLVGVGMLLDASYVRFSDAVVDLSVKPDKTSLSIDRSAFAVKEVKPDSAILTFGGDVMLARHVQTLQEKSGSFVTAWENIADVFRQADIAVVNLESPFSSTAPYPTEGFIFKAKPSNINGLKFAGIDIVTLANNHFGNAGITGAEFTFNHLADNNIQYVGAGNTAQEAYSGKIIEKNGIKIGFIAQSYNAGFGAGVNNPGVAILDINKLKSNIKELKQDADVVVAMLHGGIEYVRYPNDDQELFARSAIDAGADLVIMQHPHWIQNIERYKGRYIFYSLGNLIFDQNWSRETSEGLVVKVKVTKNDIESFELLPIVIEDNFKPRFVDLKNEEFVSLEDIENDLN